MLINIIIRFVLMLKTSQSETKLGTLSTLSIGIGGMVGGGIFAVTGLAIDITKGSAPFAFLIAGFVALLTSYSYLKLTLRYPGEGGTVQFLNQAFGNGILTGGLNILLLLSYVVLVSIYAYAFGSYGAGFFPKENHDFWQHILSSAAIILLLLTNIFSSSMVVRSENLFNTIKLLLLAGFIFAGLLLPMEWNRLEPENYVTTIGLISGAMLIFLNYEGFELIANASNDIDNPKRSLPIAYVGGVLFAIILYMLIAMVVIGHLNFTEIARNSDNVLSASARQFMGKSGYIIIAVAALLATSSAINATFFSTGKLTHIISKSGELPKELDRNMLGQPLQGTIGTAVLALIVTNFVPLEAIATMGSAGFLLIFMMVNVANIKLAKETQSKAWLSGLAAICTGLALVVLCIKVDENPATRNHLWILACMIIASLLFEIIYRYFTGRGFHFLGNKFKK